MFLNDFTGFRNIQGNFQDAKRFYGILWKTSYSFSKKILLTQFWISQNIPRSGFVVFISSFQFLCNFLYISLIHLLFISFSPTLWCFYGLSWDKNEYKSEKNRTPCPPCQLKHDNSPTRLFECLAFTNIQVGVLHPLSPFINLTEKVSRVC